MFIEAALLPGNEMVQKPEPETVLITVPVPLRQKSYGSYIRIQFRNTGCLIGSAGLVDDLRFLLLKYLTSGFDLSPSLCPYIVLRLSRKGN